MKNPRHNHNIKAISFFSFYMVKHLEHTFLVGAKNPTHNKYNINVTSIKTNVSFILYFRLLVFGILVTLVA